MPSFIGSPSIPLRTQVGISSLIAYIPNVFVAILVLFLGTLLATFVADIVRGATASANMGNPTIFAGIARWSIMGFAALVAFVLVGVSMASFGSLAMWSILLIGLFNSIMFPTIFTLGIAGLGPLTGEGSGLLVMAIVGGAVIPEIQGVIADRIGIHHAFILPLLCYLYISYYGFRGSRQVSPAI